jgi:hypothetical protein
MAAVTPSLTGGEAAWVVKNRTRISYRIEANQRFDDRDPYWLFRSFRAAMNQLVEMNDPLATLIRMAYRGPAPPHGPHAGRTLACWTINDKGEVVSVGFSCSSTSPMTAISPTTSISVGSGNFGPLHSGNSGTPKDFQKR